MDKDNNRQKDSDNILILTEVSIFDNDPYFSYIYKKSEKLAAALYMITDFLSDVEPLKTNIRLSSLSLIGKTLSLNTALSADRKNLLNQIIQDCLSLMSYSQIAVLSGIVSVMNHQIIKRELELFVKTIEEREAPQKIGKNFVLSADFIRDEALVNFNKSTQQSKQSDSPKPTNSSAFVNSQSQIQRSHVASNEVKKDRKNDRQELIIATIRGKGELSIRDLSSVIKGCSEKTIQRELLSLVEAGILNKTGERRWSRYSLVN